MKGSDEHNRPQQGGLTVTSDPPSDAPRAGGPTPASESPKIDRRVTEVDDGSAELLDGDEVLAEARTWLDAQRR